MMLLQVEISLPTVGISFDSYTFLSHSEVDAVAPSQQGHKFEGKYALHMI